MNNTNWIKPREERIALSLLQFIFAMMLQANEKMRGIKRLN
jgi:hypothetical protein